MDEVFVTLGDGIERPGVDGDALHGAYTNVIAVSP